MTVKLPMYVYGSNLPVILYKQCIPPQIMAFGLFPLRRSVKFRQRPLLGCIFSLNIPRILYGFKVITVAWEVESS